MTPAFLNLRLNYLLVALRRKACLHLDLIPEHNLAEVDLALQNNELDRHIVGNTGAFGERC